MTKRYQEPVTKMYILLIALLCIVSLTGFIDKGKYVTIQADGVTRHVYTHAVNEDALLRENMLEIGPYDEIEMSTETLSEGTIVAVRRAVPVYLEYYGVKQLVQSGKKTVQEVAVQYGYDEKNFRPYGDAAASVHAEMVIRIGALSRQKITEDEIIPFAVESVPDESLIPGEVHLLQEGKNGRKRVIMNLVSLDGQVIGKEYISSTLIEEMQPLIRHVGAPETVSINGKAVSRFKGVFAMEATAYLPADGDGNGITKMGTAARYGVVAVDPNIIPLGSHLYIPGYGVAVAEDTGSDILGNRIDLYMEDYESCMVFGRQTVPVYVLE